MKELETKYYSLDIETSGFDPLKEEILEVGFVGFVIRNKKIEIREKWSKVFRPTKPVSPRVLELTGIKQKELDSGEKFSDHKAFLQEKLGQSVIVGHNIIFDIKFLEIAGIKFSGKTVDTLDLAQMFLPTHQSYNLENLANLFNIKHKNAHRALPDCLATLELLKSLLGIYNNLPKKIQKQITALASSAGLPYEELFSVKAGEKIKIKKIKKIAVKAKKQASFVLEAKTIYSAQPFLDLQNIAEVLIKGSKQQLLLVLPKRQQVFEMWQKGLGRGMFSPDYLVDEKKVERLLKSKTLDPQLLKFLIKFKVWEATNWQGECLLDLNLTFSGGQFSYAVSGKPLPKSFTDKVLCCDHETFLEFNNEPCFRNRQAVIVGMEEFEQAMTNSAGYNVSWGHFLRALKNIYDPENQTGNVTYKDEINQLLLDTDLFFGLAKGLSYKLNGGFGDLEIKGPVVNAQGYVRLVQAGENFVEKVEAANLRLKSRQLSEYKDRLKQFLKNVDERIKWIEMSEWRFAFHDRPLLIKNEATKALLNFDSVSFVSFSVLDSQRDYFAKRLGLEKFKTKLLPTNSNLPKLAWEIDAKTDYSSRFLAVNGFKKSLPIGIVVSGLKEVDEFLPFLAEQFGLGEVSAQSKHGGTNKLFNNFSFGRKKVLIASSHLVLKFASSDQSAKTKEHLLLRSLFLGQLPLPWPMDPYYSALINSESGQAFVESKGLYSLIEILKFFYSNKLQKIAVYLPKNQLSYKDKLEKVLNLLFKNK